MFWTRFSMNQIGVRHKTDPRTIMGQKPKKSISEKLQKLTFALYVVLKVVLTHVEKCKSLGPIGQF